MKDRFGRRALVALLAAVVLMAPLVVAASGYGHGPKMPAPTAVFKDADGKAIGQLVGFWTAGGMYINPITLLNFDGQLALVEVGPKYLNSLTSGNPSFSGPDCTGDVYLGRYFTGGFAEMTDGFVAIVGPDSETGEYRVFKTTSNTPAGPVVVSSWMHYRGGVCNNYDEPVEATADIYPAAELLPNPLADFHGPTAEHPERTLVIEGGTRY